MLLEAMGLHVPGAAFVHPNTAMREALTRAAVRTLLAIVPGQRRLPIGRLVDERVIVNAMIALLATGGSTNHLIHWVAVARAAGLTIDWTDFAELSSVVPLLARVYPNGSADVNEFQAAGGTGFVLRELAQAGLLHADVHTVDTRGMAAYGRVPELARGHLQWRDLSDASGDTTILRGAADPFSATGGLRVLTGNLGRAVIKVSAVPDDRHVVEAPAMVFDSQQALARCLRGRPARARLGRRRALSGPAGQRHARAAQADAAVGGAAGPRLQGGAGHRRAHERRIGQGAGGDPRHARRPWPAARWPRCATATSFESTPTPARSRSRSMH